MRFTVQVEVTLRTGVSDPQGATLERSLPKLGFEGIDGVRVGTSIRFAIDATDESDARDRVKDLCNRFLANPAIHDYRFTVTEPARTAG